MFFRSDSNSWLTLYIECYRKQTSIFEKKNSPATTEQRQQHPCSTASKLFFLLKIFSDMFLDGSVVNLAFQKIWWKNLWSKWWSCALLSICSSPKPHCDLNSEKKWNEVKDFFNLARKLGKLPRYISIFVILLIEKKIILYFFPFSKLYVCDPLALKPSIFAGMKFVMAVPKLLLFRVTLSLSLSSHPALLSSSYPPKKIPLLITIKTSLLTCLIVSQNLAATKSSLLYLFVAKWSIIQFM